MAFVIALAVLAGCASSAVRPSAGVSQQPETFRKTVTKTVVYRYLLYLPEEYGNDKAKRWPLVIFLHGAGERGDDLNLVKQHGPPKLVEKGRSFPFILVSPQCPAGHWWPFEDLNPLLDDILARYRVDTDRVYLTGLSMGGAGTWAWAILNPERFAAIAPICGPAEPLLADHLKHVPVWVFHGAKDTTVPVRESEEMAAALRKAGGDVKLTIYPEANHDSWTQAYNNPELYEWLLKHRRQAADTNK